MKRALIGISVGFAVLLLAAGSAIVATRLGWQAPPWLGFLAGQRSVVPVDAGLFCREHGVPEKFCTLCHEELKARLVMCKEHGVPEEICTLCHPDARAKYGLTMICKEHGLPGHLCPKCHPALLGGEVKSDWCALHGVPLSLCTRCAPELAKTLPHCKAHGVPVTLCTACRPELARGLKTCPHRLPIAFCRDPSCGALLSVAPSKEAKVDLPIVRLAGADIAQKAGIEHSPAVMGTVEPAVKGPGEVSYDESRLSRTRARVPGVLVEVMVKEGDQVEAGQILAIVDSAVLGEAKADYLAALPMVSLWKRTLERNSALSDKGIAAQKTLLEAETELRKAEAEQLKARQRLRNLGLEEEHLTALPQEDEKERNRFRLKSPLQGTIVRRTAVVGDAVEATSELFTVVDLSQVWVHLDVYEKDLRRLEVGQTGVFRVPGLLPAEFAGKVIWIDTQLNDHARTVRVRLEIGNPGHILRANMFGEGVVQVSQPRTSLLVPAESLQWEGTSFVVFVVAGAMALEPRRVVPGLEVGKQVELAWAQVKPGENVVTTGSFLLKTEIQKGSIGAGCCGE